MPSTVAERIIQRRKIAAAAVQRWVLTEALPPMRRPLAKLVGLFPGEAFTHDRLVVEEFCKARSRAEADDAISLLHRAPAYEHAFVRSTLGCRISGRRLAELADGLFREETAWPRPV